eukprot:2984916-Rhodomonas_salina.2
MPFLFFSTVRYTAKSNGKKVIIKCSFCAGSARFAAPCRTRPPCGADRSTCGAASRLRDMQDHGWKLHQKKVAEIMRE